MKIRTAYYYLFYRIYKLWEAAPSKWWSDWKAALVISVLEIWLTVSILFYYEIYTRSAIGLKITHPFILTPSIMIVVLNYLMFIRTDKWKVYVKEFNQLSKVKNKVYGRIVLIVIVLIIINLVFSLHLMSRVEWSNYK